ncbi:MAG: S-adenosylmethionine:tRNA ribosyltransferase-isomerase [Candidatus Amulumruptor caecigallinarius]|nr:S-adenosylmethionine:tRNA ribosyltransferase-isomerase [Candidatus Amulumruptor caecigallinarius]
MTEVKNIKISNYNYDLPDERIARHPLQNRDSCLLLVDNGDAGVSDAIFSNIPDLLKPGTLLVCNNTRVINARIKFQKSTGALVEVFLLEPLNPEDYVLSFQSRKCCAWSCMVGNLKRWKDDTLSKVISVNGVPVVLSATKGESLNANARVVTFEWDNQEFTFADIVEAAGNIPIPPYLKRESELTDREDYQTVYAREEGSVAAPTAGLHFTRRLFEILKQKGIDADNVTLHVGAGTFQPVKSESIGGHPMHSEVFSVSKSLVENIVKALREGRDILAVGTTTVRTLESLPLLGAHILAGRNDMKVDQWEAYDGSLLQQNDAGFTLSMLQGILDYMKIHHADTLTASTSIMIAPGFKWRIVNRMITNFHQPQSTLLLLVSSFIGVDAEGHERWREIYRHALAGNYRFLSYGDASLFSRR